MDKKINKLLIRGASSESDLNYIAKALNLKINFIGSIYDLKSLTIGNYILLISPNKKVRNGHWVALKVNKDKSYYFDSYGLPPPQIIAQNLNWIRDPTKRHQRCLLKTPLYYNNEQIQDLASSHCGIYSIYFLKEGPNMIKHFKIHNVF